MCAATRMPRYDIRNDGMGPYATFYCDRCDREYRSQPDVAGTVATDVGRQAAGNLLRGIPLFGRAVADTVSQRDQRYSTTMTPQQLEKAWAQVQDRFRECPTCGQIVCLSDFDMQSGFCREDSPRGAEIAEAQAEQAAGVVKGIASVFGIGGLIQNATEAAKAASATTARCPKDGTVAPAGTKFCPECGSPMVQPAAQTCPSCGAAATGSKFCPQCGAKTEAAAPATCRNCGKELKGAKFCPECGTRAE
ncbi:MAG: zinc ribbon domain-containing protein [Anaerolineae bacterium]